MISSTRLGRGALAAIFVAGCLVAPAAVAQSADRGSSDRDPARANVYVPTSPDTATRDGQRWFQTHPAPQDLPDPRTTANVYVPPAGEQSPATGGSYAHRISALSDAQLAAAYGTAIPTWIPTPANATAASDDGTNGWEIAAIVEAGLIAAIALGSAAFIRRRALRTGV
jgi:hypothetical protein